MGLKCAPDFAQQIMEQILYGLNGVKFTLIIGIFGPTWEKNQVLLNKVLS